MTKFVTYSNDNEVFVTMKKIEKEFLKQYGDRDFENDYEREEIKDLGVAITSRGFWVR